MVQLANYNDNKNGDNNIIDGEEHDKRQSTINRR